MLPGFCFDTTSRFLFAPEPVVRVQTNFDSKAGLQISSKQGGATSAVQYFLLALSVRISLANCGCFWSFRCLSLSGVAMSMRSLAGTSSSSAAAVRSSVMSLKGTGLSRSADSARTFSSAGAEMSRVSETVMQASCNLGMPAHVDGITEPSSDLRQPLATNCRASSRPLPPGVEF